MPLNFSTLQMKNNFIIPILWTANDQNLRAA